MICVNVEIKLVFACATFDSRETFRHKQSGRASAPIRDFLVSCSENSLVQFAFAIDEGVAATKVAAIRIP